MLFVFMKWTKVSAPLLSVGGQLSVPNFEKGGSKKVCFVGLIEFLQGMFFWGAYYVTCQARLCKIKYGFEGSISNVDVGLL